MRRIDGERETGYQCDAVCKITSLSFHTFCDRRSRRTASSAGAVCADISEGVGRVVLFGQRGFGYCGGHVLAGRRVTLQSGLDSL